MMNKAEHNLMDKADTQNNENLLCKCNGNHLLCFGPKQETFTEGMVS